MEVVLNSAWEIKLLKKPGKKNDFKSIPNLLKRALKNVNYIILFYLRNRV